MSEHEMKKTCLGVIGGSGLYNIEGMEIIKEEVIETPFGQPSDALIHAKIGDRPVFFLPRHGKGHRFTPTEVNYRANIFALKRLGVTHILSVSAVGIMQEHINPGDMIIPDQLFDRTKGERSSTFFGEGLVGHISFADPFCSEMRELIKSATSKKTKNWHDGGTLVIMEGPAFSTRAESHYYRKTLNPVAIGMTAIPESKLAREAEMSYGLLAMATDYDCWNEKEDDVSVEAVVAVLKANAKLACGIVKEVANLLPEQSNCPSLYAAEFAVMTQKDLIPETTKEKLQLLYGNYFK